MTDERIQEKEKMTFIHHFTSLTDIYTISATKYISHPCFSECQHLKQ